jgi:cytosine/uracil/thiamine/allantoin permease
MGLFIGIVIGLLGLIFKDHIGMRRSIIGAIKNVFITAIVFAIIGFLWGKYHLTATGVDWWMPDDLIDKNNFIVVGSIHNFSYMGGIAGLLIAMAYMIRKNILIKKAEQRTER